MERGTLIDRRRPWLAVALLASSLAAGLPPGIEGAEAAKKKNGIIFTIQTSQGITGRITYLKRYEGEGRSFAQLEVEVLANCVGDGGPYSERANVILTGHTAGNAFFADFYPQNTATDQYRQTANVSFAPKGRRGGLPRWRRASGTVQYTRSIHDPFVNVDCDSGPVSFETVAARRAKFGPRPPIIVVVAS